MQLPPLRHTRYRRRTVADTVARTLRCPSCRTPIVWSGNPHRPFCSQRCRIVDLGAWADDRYRVPGDPVPGDDESSSGDAGE